MPPSTSSVKITPLAPLCMICTTNAGKNYLYPGILKCPSCGLVFADTHVSGQELKQLYQRDYFFGDEYLNYLEDKITIQKNFAARIRTLRTFAPSGNLFEIGCAYGFFLELARKYWHAEGCDISTEGCEYAQHNGINATCGEFLELPVIENHYDVVALWDTIEHLAQPDLYIEKAARLLKPHGILCATTGDIGSLMARLRKEHWRLIHPPTHLFYFDKQTITRLFAKHGLEVIHIEHCGYYRSVHQVLYSILVLNSDSAFRKKLYRMFKPLFDFSVYLNLFDIMFVIARKK